MSSSNPLSATQLARFDDADLDHVLAYLNRPPVGGLSDRTGAPDLTDPYEIQDPLRKAIRAQRERGGLSAPTDLLGIPGFE